MPASLDGVNNSFEKYLHEVLQNTVDYIEGDEQVAKIWFYTDTADGLATYVYFEMRNGDFLDIGQIDAALGYQASPDDVLDFLAKLDQENRQAFLEALLGCDETPFRIISVYDNLHGGLKGDWDYTDPRQSLHPREARLSWVQSRGGIPR